MEIMEHYFNTNNETGETLKESNEKAKTQEAKILEIFKNNPDKNFTPSDIWKIWGTYRIPLTSIRRAISNLSNPKIHGDIIKTPEMRLGIYGKLVHTWILKP